MTLTKECGLFIPQRGQIIERILARKNPEYSLDVLIQSPKEVPVPIQSFMLGLFPLDPSGSCFDPYFGHSFQELIDPLSIWFDISQLELSKMSLYAEQQALQTMNECRIDVDSRLPTVFKHLTQKGLPLGMLIACYSSPESMTSAYMWYHNGILPSTALTHLQAYAIAQFPPEINPYHFTGIAIDPS